MRRLAHNWPFIFPTLFLLLSLSASVWMFAAAGARSGANSTAKGASSVAFTLRSADFAGSGEIPKQFTCSGEDRSPALEWTGAPAATRSFALIADDPDAPGSTWVHWVIFNIPASANGLPSGVEKKDQLADGTRQGRNDFRKIGYNGPCPPPGKAHRYFFKLYALNAEIALAAGASKSDLEHAMEGHILGKAEWMGTFRR